MRLQLERSRSSLLPMAPVLLEWRALGCGYRARGGGWTAVLRGVYGYAAPGSLTAVMGPSGSGRSVLLLRGRGGGGAAGCRLGRAAG
jgi:ABC-type glutathione transport system ATPase component